MEEKHVCRGDKNKEKGFQREETDSEMKTRESGRSYFQRVQVIQGNLVEGEFHVMEIRLATPCPYILPLGCFLIPIMSLHRFLQSHASHRLQSEVTARFLAHIFSNFYVPPFSSVLVKSRAMGQVNWSPWKMSPSVASFPVDA